MNDFENMLGMLFGGCLGLCVIYFIIIPVHEYFERKF